MSVAWLNTGDNAWQLTAATIVGMQSVPGLVVLYAGIVKKKWAVNSAFMAFYAFAAVMIAWLLWGYNMAFGHQWFSFVGIPGPIASMNDELMQTVFPTSGSTAAMPMATMVYFQFVFAAITLVIMAGAFLGRMSFKAWMIFVPLWLTFSYTVGAFSLWGGGFLSTMGVIDYSGGYVIHLSAGIAGFVGAAVIGPRLARDRENFQPNNVLLMLVGAGILWLGWNGFNGGDPYAASRDAGAAVLNTNVATAMSVLTWTVMDIFYFKKPAVIGAVQGMITGLVAITPAAGVVDGYGAIAIGIASGIIPWISMNIVGKTALFRKVDDTLGVFHTHAVAGVLGGIMVGLLATKEGCKAYGLSNPGGALTDGNWHQVWLQIIGAAFIIALNIVVTYILLKLISLIVPLRMSEEELMIGDDAIHGEEAYAFYGDGERRPVTGD
ncbi:ammonium transporter [Acidithiobacillus thiooxidans]|uniref:Ammonium transporter n=1 Tax=Acidithiobacillus thiooxidans TaxID=930 RepID=A0A1C2J264_ACITH|nr:MULTISPECIES: ammonium transporter [Acidithiobacillus]MBE7566218.1 ammonium transporter [Acidithiobacillus sp. HP-11]MBU2751485.1 ammonium transporter [Acidithiobacillus thiooxidans]MBU2793289.1 ammonium transporter [Acidithiobacillus thiooxidans]MBU2841033.1 ammonium transporter [Acidithiobacillus thiooxidans]OCX69059.1 ammonium transporter [Acidithiobacillus thiooxidans]